MYYFEIYFPMLPMAALWYNSPIVNKFNYFWNIKKMLYTGLKENEIKNNTYIPQKFCNLSVHR